MRRPMGGRGQRSKRQRRRYRYQYDDSGGDYYGHYDPDERQRHRIRMDATEAERDDTSAVWDQAGKHVQIGSHDHEGFHPHISGPTAVRKYNYEGHECVGMATHLVMRSGVHSISVRAGNYNQRDGHVRVGVGPPSFFEQPARMSVEQEVAHLPHDFNWNELLDDNAAADMPKYLAQEAASGVMWSGHDGKVWADGEGARWGCDDGDGGQNCYTYEDVISLKLDLTSGVLEAYKNGTSLGIVREDMRGPLCWACELWYEYDCCIIVKGKSAI